MYFIRLATDVGMKSSPNFSKSKHSSFYYRSYDFHNCPKVTKYLHYVFKKFVAKNFKKSPNLVKLPVGMCDPFYMYVDCVEQKTTKHQKLKLSNKVVNLRRAKNHTRDGR